MAQDLLSCPSQEAGMLRITPKVQDTRLTLALEGKLAGPWVAELAKVWSDWQGKVRPGDTTLDLSRTTFVDEAGRGLLAELNREGCVLLGGGCYVGKLVEGIIQGRETGAALPRWCALAALGLAVAGTLAAAEPPPLSLTLGQALRTALAQNSDVQRSLLAVAQSQEDRRAAASALMPTLEAGAQGTRLRYNLDTQLGSPSPGGPDMIGPFSWGTIAVQASVPVLDLSLWDRWKAARHGQRTAEAQARETREAVTALTVGQYLRLQRAAESVRAAQSRVELARVLEQLAQDQQKHGLGTRLDTLRAQVQVRNEQQRLIQAETQVQAARFALARVLNLEPAVRVDAADGLATPDLPALGFQDAYRAGLRQRPEMAALEAREQAQTELRNSARDLAMPTVVASGNYGSTGLSHAPWGNTWTVSVGVKVPLFTGGRISAQTARAQDELERIKQERRGLEAEVGMEVQTAQAELEAGRNEVAVATEAQDLAQQALEQARHRFEAGVANNIEVVQAQDELARATDNRINALYRLNQSRADLARAMGQLEAVYVR
jgi:outer membrane protein TolC